MLNQVPVKTCENKGYCMIHVVSHVFTGVLSEFMGKLCNEIIGIRSQMLTNINHGRCGAVSYKPVYLTSGMRRLAGAP
jgi:hypothetical protein